MGTTITDMGRDVLPPVREESDEESDLGDEGA